MNNCFIYCRKSSEDKSRQILSLGDQEKIAKELAFDRGLSILHIFKESKSAKRPDIRTEFKKMVDAVIKGPVKTIFCWKADRLARNAKEGGILIDLVDYSGLKIITPAMEYDRENSTWLFIEFGMATKFSKDLSDGVKRGIKTKLEMGMPPGVAPIGYINNTFKLKGQKDISPDPKTFELCRKWWDLMLTGQHTVKSSLEEITRLGLRNKKGGIFSMPRAYHFFRNVLYTGLFDYAGKRYKGIYPPIITMDEYDQVQQILNRRMRVKKVQNDYYFMKALTCGECGCSITAENHIKHYKNGKDQTFVYARCSKKKGKCSQPYLNADKLKKQVEDFIKDIQLSPALSEWLKMVIKRRANSEIDFARNLRVQQTKRLDQNFIERKKLFDMKADGMITNEEFDKEKSRLLTEEKELSNTTVYNSYWSTLEDAINFATNVTQIFKEGDLEERRMILKILGSNLILKDKKVEIEARNAFVLLKEADNSLKSSLEWLEPKKRVNYRSNKPAEAFQKTSERGTRFELATFSLEGRRSTN